jgi:hypothetical protein
MAGIQLSCMVRKNARLHNLPVSFAEIKRQKRGFYTLELSMIAENPLELEDGEITRRYAAKLESMIRANPETGSCRTAGGNSNGRRGRLISDLRIQK